MATGSGQLLMLDPSEYELREYQYQALEWLGYVLSLPTLAPTATPAVATTGPAVKTGTRAELTATALRVLRWDRPAPAGA